MDERTKDDESTADHQETTTTYERQVHERSDADGRVISWQVRESVSTSGGDRGSGSGPSEGSDAEATGRAGTSGGEDDDDAGS